MSRISQYQIGQIVELAGGQHATVRFLGTTHFQAGEWIGVEFDEPDGKNDGSVQGQRYFDCELGHGMFLRPDKVDRIVEEPTPKPAASARPKSVAAAKPAPRPLSTAATAKTTSSRPSIAGRPSAVSGRTGASDPAAKRRETMNNTSPSPAPRSVASSSHTRTPSKLGPGAVGKTSTAGTAATTRASTSTTTAAAARRPGSTTAPAATPRATASTGRPSISGPASRTPATAPASRAAATRPSVGSRAGLAGAPAGSRTSVTSAGSRTSVGRRPSASIAGSKPPQRSAAEPPPVKASQNNLDDVSSELDENPGEQDDEQSEGDADTNGHGQEQQDGNEEQQEEDEDGDDEVPAAEVVPKTKPAAKPRAPAPTARAPATRTTATTRPAARPSMGASGAASSRQIQDLETKLSTLERRRDEDKEKLKTLEKIQSERDRFETIIQKMQKKYQPQAEEIADLRKKQKEADEKINELEDGQGEHETDLEMAYLDKEMAEEVADALRTELDALKTKHEEVTLEVEVLREENEELSKDLSPEERNTANHYQLQLRLQRTQDALVRLRDVTQDTEADLKSQIEGLEKEIEEIRGVKDKYEEAQEKLKQSDSVVEDLRAQLETALGAEDMIEELTEKNMSLAEQMEGLKLAIQDLEDLKEVNDELEYNHVEAERQMMEEIDFKDSVLGEQRQRMLQKDEKLADYEYTISKFRELVASLQTDIQEMRSTQQISEAEAEELSSRSKAMNDLNLRLQTSAARTVVNTVDMELRRLEAQEAVEHLAIVQMFLPESFRSERDSVRAYLRFKRVAAKARLLHSQLRDRLSGGPSARLAENAFGLCDVLDKLIWISSICDRFSNNISASTLDRFARYEGALYELDPVEKGLNLYIEQLKKTDVREESVAEELQRSIALLAHLSEVHIPEDDLEAYADDVLMRTALIQSYLDNTASALSMAKTMIPSPDGESDGDVDSLNAIKQQMDTLIGQTRSAKVIAGKTLSAITELKDRSMALTPAVSEEPFAQCQHTAKSIASLARQLGETLRQTHEAPPEDGDTSVRSLVRSAIAQFARQSGSNEASKPLSALTVKIQTASQQLQTLVGLSQDLSLAVEFERLSPPWIQRSQALQSSSNISATAEAELKRLKDDIQERAMLLRQRDQSIEEQTVKIELLESRTKDAQAKAHRITELQKLLEAGKARERELTEAIESKFREISQLASERDHWQRTAHERKPSTDGAEDKDRRETAVASSREMEALKQEIAGLKGAVRLLREDNVRIRLAGPNEAHMAWLATPLGHKPSEKEQRVEQLRQEGMEVCAALLDAAIHCERVDLGALPGNKLAWRPAKTKSRWMLARQKERWAGWHAMRDGFLSKSSLSASVH